MNQIFLDEKYKDIIEKMLKIQIGEDGESIFSLMDEIGFTDDKKFLLWASIISGLQEHARNNGEELTHTLPIFEQDITEQSLIDIIQRACDLKDDQNYRDLFKSYFYEDIYEKENFWNESINELIQKIKELIEQDPNTTVLNIDENNKITIENLENADAGFNFSSQVSQEQWVEPNINIDGKSYDDVRYTDEVEDILKNKNKLQFTNNHSKWITLLMPQYGRRVEVEDLDRNFWVIADVIDSISSWIFEGSPISGIIKKMLDEVEQLWENILYLWIQIAVMNQNKTDSVRTISFFETYYGNNYVNPTRYGTIPYTTAKLNTLNTYDIEEPNYYFLGTVQQRNDDNCLIQFEKQYSEQNLAFLPIVRANNYHSCYYSGEYYKQLILSKVSVLEKNGKKVIGRKRIRYKLKEIIGDGEEMTTRDIVISPRDEEPFICDPLDNETRRFSTNIYGINYINNKYYYSFPFSNAEQCFIEGKSIFLYGMLRVIPEVDIKITEYDNEKILNFVINVYDAAAEVVLGQTRLIGSFELDHVDEQNKQILFRYNKKITQTEYDDSYQSNQVKMILEKGHEDVNKAFYLGEVASWRKKTSTIYETENLFNSEAILLKIGNFLPDNEDMQYQNAYIRANGVNIPTQMRGNFTVKNYGTANTLSFYAPDWATYISNYDYPNIFSPDCCFTSINKIPGSQLTVNKIDNLGLNAIKNYILKVRKDAAHMHRDIFKTPCFFLTFIGLTPWQGTGQVYWDIAMVCHAYKYIPAMISMDREETVGENYKKAYDQFNVGAEGAIIDENGIEIGKIISSQFINRYESYYDSAGFGEQMLQNWTKRGDIFDSSGWRAIKVNSAIDEDIEYCKRLTLRNGSSSYVAYNVKFSKIFKGEVQYYDARWAGKQGYSDFLINPNTGSLCQVSNGIIEIDGDSYSQIEKGAIRKCNKTSFDERVKNTSFLIKEKNVYETNFLIGSEEKKFPFRKAEDINSTLIPGENFTPKVLFNAWTNLPAGAVNKVYLY